MDTTHAQAEAPSRSTGSVTVSWGLVTIPCSIYSAAEDIRVARHEFTNDGNAVGRRSYDKVTGDNVDAADVIKRATASDGSLVDLTDDEIEQATLPVKGEASIESFIPLSAIGTTYHVASECQIRPAMVKKAYPTSSAKAFALLCKSMEDQGLAALVKVAMRGPAKYAAVCPDGRLVFLHFAEEVRAPRPEVTATFTDAELAAAKSLIDAVGTSVPVLNDKATAALQKFVDAKAAAGDSYVAPVAPAPAAALTDDLAAMLEAAVAAAKAAKSAAA
jgi:DNA end-binding protein Ku